MKCDVETFYKDNEKLIHFCIKRLNISLDNNLYDDLFQEGCLALLELYDRYDSDKGEISTYAVKSITGKLITYLNKNRTMLSCPIHDASDSYKINRLIDNNPGMTSEDVCEQLNITYDRYRELQKISTVSSLDQPARESDGEDSETLVQEMIASNYNLEDEVVNNITIDELIDIANSKFKNNSLNIILDYIHNLSHGEIPTLQSIGNIHNVSRERVRQVINKYRRIVISKYKKGE